MIGALFTEFPAGRSKRRPFGIAGVLLFFFPAFFPAVPAAAAEPPLQARVLRVIDGDTAEVVVRLRLRRIDAPELKGRCAAETRRAEAAKKALAGLAPPGRNVFLTDLGIDRYGRLLAEAVLADGRSAGKLLVSARLAVPWGGGRPDWCAGETQR